MSFKLVVYPTNFSTLLEQDGANEALAEKVPAAAGQSESVATTPESVEGVLRYDWCLLETTGQCVARGAGDSDISILRTMARSDVQNVRLVALLPAEYTTAFEVSIPLKQQKFLTQALPFAVEEQLACDIDDVHIVTGQRKPRQENIPVTIVERNIMARFLDELQNFALPIYHVVPDAALIPLDGETKAEALSVLLLDRVALLRKDQQFWKVPKSALSRYLERIVPADENGESGQINLRCYLPEAAMDEETIHVAAIEQVCGSKATVMPFTGDSSVLLAQTWLQDPDAAPQLCQGEFAQKSERTSGLKNWMGVAAIVAVWFVIQLGLNVAQGVYYQKQAESYEQQALKMYQSIFPGEKRVTADKVERFLKSKLIQAGQQGGGQSFLDVLTLTGSEFKRANLQRDMSFKNINFNSQRGELSVELQVSKLEQLDMLKNALDKQGLSVKIGSAVKEKDFVRGRLTITSAG